MCSKARILAAALLPVVLVLGCSKPEAPPPPTTTTLPATTTTTAPPVPLEVKLKAILDGEVPGYRQCLDKARAKNPYGEISKAERSKPATLEEAKRALDESMANADRLLKHMQAENKCHDQFVALVKPKMTEAGATAEQAEAALKPLGKERRCARCQ